MKNQLIHPTIKKQPDSRYKYSLNKVIAGVTLRGYMTHWCDYLTKIISNFIVVFESKEIFNMYIRAILIFLVVLTTGCSTSSIKKEYSFDGKVREGLAVFSVSHDQKTGIGNTQSNFLHEWSGS